MIEAALAFCCGSLTLLSPCVLPMLPVILGASVGRSNPLRPLAIAGGFVVSFSVVALALGTVATTLGLSATTLRSAAIAGLFVFGFLMIWPAPFELLSAPLGRLAGRAARVRGDGTLGAFVLGATLAVAWTPCAGPVLGAALTQVATSGISFHAALLILCFALGEGLVMLAIARSGQLASRRIRGFLPWAHRVQQAFGGVVILAAIAMRYRYDALLTLWIANRG